MHRFTLGGKKTHGNACEEIHRSARCSAFVPSEAVRSPLYPLRASPVLATRAQILQLLKLGLDDGGSAPGVAPLKIEPGADKRLANILKKALNTPPKHVPAKDKKAAVKK